MTAPDVRGLETYQSWVMYAIIAAPVAVAAADEAPALSAWYVALVGVMAWIGADKWRKR